MGRKVPKYHDLLHAATDAADRAAVFIRAQSRPPTPGGWEQKGVSDFVTHIDRGAEEIIADVLLTAVPDSSVRGEELTPQPSAAGLVWIVDPLDGTTNYLHDYPAYAVSIAALLDGVLTVGVVVNVPTGDVFTAVRNEGAWCNDRPLAVSRVQDPAMALIGTGFPFKALDLLPVYLDQFAEILTKTSGIRRAGAAALDLVDVACGRFEGFWELHLAPWDVAAGTLLVREAGGVVTDTTGSSDVIRHGSIVAGNASVHAWLLDTLASS